MDVSDKFDVFLSRLEMPLSDPVIVTMADKAVSMQVACVKCAGDILEQALCLAMPANTSGRRSVS